MKTIRHKATLYYYDGPQVFEACDSNGEYYIAVMVEPDGSHDQYLVAVVEPERLQQFRIGALDLRSLLTERRDEEWFLAKANGGMDAPLALRPQSTALAACSYLPEPGFLLHDAPAPANADVGLGHAGLDCGCIPTSGSDTDNIENGNGTRKMPGKMKEGQPSNADPFSRFTRVRLHGPGCDSFTAALDNARIQYERRSPRPQPGIIMNVSGDVLLLVGHAIPWASVATVLVAWIKARGSRKIFITTKDGKVLHTEGYGVEDFEQILPQTSELAVLDTNKSVDSKLR